MTTHRPFAVFDIDGTLVRWQLYHAIADTLVKLGYAQAKDYAPVQEARMLWKRRSASEAFRAYEQQLVDTYEKVLLGLTYEQFDQAAQSVFEEYKDQVYTYTRDLIKQLKDQGYLLFAISGSQTEVVRMIADYYGFDDFKGTVYERGVGGFTGKVTVHREGKHIILGELIRKHSATTKGSYGVGDSEGDITMLASVENPIAMNPTRKLFEHASAEGWKIVIERKNMVYELEKDKDGYHLR